jgi:hypothetical protein
VSRGMDRFLLGLAFRNVGRGRLPHRSGSIPSTRPAIDANGAARGLQALRFRTYFGEDDPGAGRSCSSGGSHGANLCTHGRDDGAGGRLRAAPWWRDGPDHRARVRLRIELLRLLEFRQGRSEDAWRAGGRCPIGTGPLSHDGRPVAKRGPADAEAVHHGVGPTQCIRHGPQSGQCRRRRDARAPRQHEP